MRYQEKENYIIMNKGNLYNLNDLETFAFIEKILLKEIEKELNNKKVDNEIIQELKQVIEFLEYEIHNLWRMEKENLDVINFLNNHDIEIATWL